MSTDPLDFILELAERVKELTAREEALQARSEHTFENLLALASSLTGDQKVEMIKAMGFMPVGGDHQGDCLRYVHGPGFICGCVPPATMWDQPHDVDVYRKETWEDRKALAEKWSREGTHGRQKEDD